MESTSQALLWRQKRNQHHLRAAVHHLAITHSPQLDEAIISARHNEGLHKALQFCIGKRH
jgi:hypothetical protein